VTLNRREGEWYATFVVERKGPKHSSAQVVGVDIGMVSIVSTSQGRRYGQVSAGLRRRVERAYEKRRRKQKLNACLKRKNHPTVRLNDGKAEAFARNEIGRALNQMLDELPKDTNVALERLTVKDMRFKSRQMNRALGASQLGYVCDKLKYKLDERDLRYRSVQPAYSSQQCSQCGFEANADENAAQVIAERFGDDELNALSLREVETTLAMRFMRRLPRCSLPSDTRSVSARLELQPAIWLPRGKVAAQALLPTVNQPG
jgi:putative transposase